MDRKFRVVSLLLVISILTLLALTNVFRERSSPGRFDFGGVKELKVPFVRQKPFYCSEACASMLLAYYDINISQEEINQRGYYNFEVMLPLLNAYISCSYVNANYSLVKREIDEGRPVMARIEVNGFRHTVLIVGYDGDHLLVHDPALGPYVLVDTKDFYGEWRRTDFLAIICRDSSTKSQ